MMSHGELKELVFALRDGEALDLGSRERAQGHLADCGECRAALEAWDKSSKALFAKPSVAGSEEFTRSVLRRVRSLPEPVSWTGRLAVLFPRLLVAGAVAAAVALVVMPRRSAAPVPQETAQSAVSAPAQEAEDESYGMLEAGSEDSEYGTAIEEYFL